MKDKDKIRAVNYGMKLLTARQKTEKEMVDKLKAKNFTDDIIHYVLSYLKSYGYLDDKKYVELFLREKININRYGTMKLRNKLLQKGIPSELIEEGLGRIDEETMIENAVYLANKKINSLNGQESIDIRHKVYRHLASKGYSYTTIAKALTLVMF
ncbi:MAG: Regulatory protein RecX [Clostridiales bacterium 38_11]|nr:MAG: Regulatory protein RecX [Clostridiales bacterium 38_11]